MKKLILLLVCVVLYTSCADPCTDTATVQYLSSKTPTQTSIIIVEDTCIEGDLSADFITINGNKTLTVLGDITSDYTVRFNGDGKISATGSIILGGNVFFLGGGTIEADMGLVITGHAKENGYGGTIKYCNFQSIGTLDEELTLIQDCDNPVSCTTLSDDGVDVTNGGTIELPCDFDYKNQVVKTNRYGTQYIYVKNQ
jgi:hypothetical protein